MNYHHMPSLLKEIFLFGEGNFQDDLWSSHRSNAQSLVEYFVKAMKYWGMLSITLFLFNVIYSVCISFNFFQGSFCISYFHIYFVILTLF